MSTKGNSPGSLIIHDAADSPYERRAVLSAFASQAVLSSMSLYMVAGTSVRIAIYASDSDTNTGGMALVADLGPVTRPAGADGMQAVAIPGSPVLAAGKRAVIAVRYVPNVAASIPLKDLQDQFPPTGNPDGDVIRSRRKADLSDFNGFGGIGTAFPSVSAADDGNEEETRVLCVSLTYTDASSDTTAPTATAGPTIGNVTLAGYDVTATWDEGCTVSVLVTAPGAGQPLDAAFDASIEKATATAGTPLTIHHNG